MNNHACLAGKTCKEKLPIPTEMEEQIIFCQWLDLMGYKYSAIPNSTYTTSWNQKMKNKRLGLHAGLPDMLVIVPNPSWGDVCVWVEMKRKKRGVVSESQQDWIDILKECNGTHAYICKGANEAIERIKYIANF